MQFKELGSLFENGELAALFNGGGLKTNNFKTASSISDMQNITAEMFNKQFRINADGVSEFSKAQIEAKANAIGLTDSLKNEVLAMASDATMTDKLRTGKLTWAKAIDTAGDSINDVGDALIKSGKLSKEKGNALKAVIDQGDIKKTRQYTKKTRQYMKDMVNDVDGLADSFTSLGEVEKASTSSLGDGLKGMLVSLKAMLPVIAAVGAAIAVYKAWDYTQTGFTRAQEKFENSLSNYKNTKSEIESLNSELDNTKSKIDELKELQNNGVITFAEEVELEKLQHTNDELEKQLEIKTKLAEAQSKIVAENAKVASSKEQSYTEKQREKYGTFLGTLKSIGDSIVPPTKQYTDSDGNVTFDTEKHHWKEENNYDTTITSQFTSNIKKLSDAKKELSETEKELAKNPQDKFQLKNQKEQLKNIEEITSALSNQYDTIQGWVESSTDEYGNALKGSESYVKQWKDAINEYVNMDKTKNEKYLNNLENYFSSSKSGSSMKDYLVSLAKDGKSAEEALEAFRASGMRLKDIGVSENAFVRYFEDIKREAQEADEAVRSVDGTFDGLKKSFESENQGANYDTTMGYYKTAKEMYKNGLVGTDDFKSMAQFGVGYDIAKKLKDNADAYTYASDAYVEAWEQSQALLERWYGNEDELTNMTNVLNDFKDAGLASSLGDNEWTFKNDDGSMKFKTTAEAADKLNTSVSNVELAMSKLEEHGFEFDGIEKSGELLENYKNSLDQIKDVYDSMEGGAQKDRLKKLIEGYDSEYEKFQDDLSGLSEDQIVKIKFEYDLASIQQKIQELKSMAEASGSNQDQAALRVTQEQALGMLEGKTGVTKDSDEGYAQSYAKRTSLTKDMAGKSEEERAAINQEINALLELQNAFQQFKLDGGELDWNSFLDTPTATALFNDLVEKGTLTEKQIKELFGDSITCNIDAKLNDDDLQKKLTSLKTDEKITFKADVDNLDNAQVEAVKNQDGTIKYTANVAGVPKEVHKITEQDGTIRFTTEFDGSLDWINNNLQNGETITYKADVSGIQKDIEACKDENGTIHYCSVMDDGSKQELTQQTDKDGKITYVADTSEVENAVKNTESQNPKVKVELTPDEQRVQDALKSLLNDQTKTTFFVDADFSKVKDDINALEVWHLITFKADVDNLDNAQVEAVKNQDGTIKYTANVAGVPKEVHKITEQDGTIRFTTEFDGSLDWINNNLQNGETITYKADVSGIQKDIEACKDENGTIHYCSVMDDGSKQELTQQTDKDGKITYVADTSEVENAVKNTESQNPKVKVELTPDEQRVQDALKSLLNDQTKTTFFVDADFSKVKDDINALEVGHSIVFTANVDGVDQAVAAVKYQDGSIGYIANVDGVYYQLSAVQNTDGTVSYTIGNYPTEVPNANQTIDRTPNNSQVSQSPSSVGQAVNRTPNNSGILHAPTIVQKVIRFFTGGDKLLGTAHASGTLSDSFNLKDSWKTKKDEVALTGEVGEELVVSGNRWFTTGSNGAEFANIPAGSVVFNSKQTKELLSQGFTKSRGKGNPSLPGLPAFLEGTAYASGGRLPSSSSSSSPSSKKKSSSSSSKSSSKSSSNNSSTSSSKSNSSSGSSNDKEETKETLDWIETKLDRIKRKIDELDTTASSTYRTWSKRNEALSSELSKVTEKISLQQQAYDRYIKEAESAGEGLSSDWIDKIQNGKIDVETITDSDLKEKISDYKNWYEKALDCRDAIIDLKEQESKLIEQRFNNVKDEYDAILKQFEHTQSMLEGAIDITETSGYIVSTKYYDSLISNENEKINKLYAEREALVNSLNSALSSGKIDKYSESWYNMQDEIDSIDESIQDCNKSTIEWGNSIRQIQWDLFDKLQDRISKINDEADFLKELMSSEKMYDDKNGGQITEYGKATFGLHGVKHNTLMAQADEYRKEMEKIDEQLKSDPFNQTLIDRRNELLKLQQESITSAKQEKDAIKDLVEDGINSQLDALQKLIDKYTDLLDTNKDMYDYQKQLAEKQKEISSIEKQLAAYQGDTSEEGASKRQQLQNDLNDAKQDLAETQYERSIADQKKLLDDLYEQYEEVLNMRLDNIDVLVSDVIANVNSEAGAIRDTLEAKADSVGYTMTESMNTIWNSANQVITNYGTNFLSSITGVQNAINDLTNLIKQAVDASNKKASAGSSSTKPSSSTSTPKPATPTPTPKPATTSSGDGVPNVGDAVTFNSGAYYYSSDGISPTGTQMHGQTVYITKINNASWAKKKYHIAKDRNATHPLGWVDLSQISGYEKGIKSVPKDEMAVVGEHKKPETIVLDDGSILTPLSKNSSVFNNDAHENLWSFANDPQRFIESMIQNPPEVPNMFNEFTANQTNTVTINIPIDKVSDYNDFVRQLQKDSKFEKMVQTMVLEPIVGNSTIGKYKQRF